MRAWLGSTALVLGLFVCGCGGPPPEPPEAKDPAMYAKQIKNLVTNFVTDTNPKDAKTGAAVLVETLENYKNSPVGQNEAIYSEMLERCKELAAGGDARKKMSDLAALAKKL